MSRSSTAVKLGSRAVTRRIEAGSMVLCQHCQTQVKFVAKRTSLQVIANVYVDGRWNRVEHFHAECYELADSPWGPPQEDNTSSTRRAMATASPSVGVSTSSGASGGS